MSVGVDFGTSFSCIARVGDDGRGTVVRSPEGEDKTPSVTFFGADETFVGTAALNAAEDAGEEGECRAVSSVKRRLLSPPRIALPDGRSVTPGEVVEQVFSTLRRSARSADEEAMRAVVTYPAVFDPQQVRVITDAAGAAGFDEIEMLEEPVAAAMAFERHGGQIGRSVLVYDLGGGTFDAACVVREPGEHRFYLALEPAGDAHCGGDDLDQVLYDHFDRQARRETGCAITMDDRIDAAFLRNCRRRKESLSKSRHVTFSTLLGDGNRFTCSIGRDEFESLISDLVDRTIRITQQVADDARAAGHPLDTVLLVGGSSQVALIHRRISETLGMAPQHWGQRDYAVALGAAYHAATIWPGKRTSGTSGPAAKPRIQDPLHVYSRAVEMAWSDGQIDAHEALSLGQLAVEIGLSADQVATIQQSVISAHPAESTPAPVEEPKRESTTWNKDRLHAILTPLDEIDQMHMGGKIPELKLANALARVDNPKTTKSSVVGLLDLTLLGSAKNFLLFEPSRLHGRLSGPTFTLPYATLSSEGVQAIGKRAIVVGGNKIPFVREDDRNLVLAALREIAKAFRAP